MPDWPWLLLAAMLGAVTALAVPLLMIYYYWRSFEKPTAEERFSMPVTLPPVSYFILDVIKRSTGLFGK